MSDDYKNIPVKFFYRDVKQNFLSKEAGKPIWKTEEFISILKPGENSVIVDVTERKVKPLDIERWGHIYTAWKNKEEQIQQGTRIEVLPGIENRKIELCKSLNIFTLESLINIDEDGVKNLGHGAREFILEAKKYLHGSTAVDKIQKEMDVIAAENKKLLKENKELKERNYELINNGAECGERDATGTSTNNGSGKRRRVHKTGAVSSDESGAGAVSAA